MRIIKLGSYKEHIKFMKELYKDDPYFIDNKSGLYPLICHKHTSFYCNSTQQFIAVREEHTNTTLCQAVLIHHKQYKDTLMLAFFEAKPNQLEAVQHLIAYAKEVGMELQCKRIEVGVDGHCNYNIGLLASHFKERPSFGQAYNPPYYNTYFEITGFKKKRFISFINERHPLDTTLFRLIRKSLKEEVTLEYGDFSRKGLAKTIHRYTTLNNTIFKEHTYYYPRSEAEDIALFQPMIPLLRKENLIFATKNGKDVGFILWYPDYNELASTDKEVGIGTYLRYKWLKRPIKKVKLVEMGVLSPYEGSGLIIMLLQKAYETALHLHPTIETVMSSWILEENQKSRTLSNRFLTQKYKEFVTYELPLSI